MVDQSMFALPRDDENEDPQVLAAKEHKPVEKEGPKEEAKPGRGLLEDLAPKITVKGGGPGGSGLVWEVSYSNGTPSILYLDASGVVKGVQSWIDNRCRFVGTKRSSALPALLVSGLIKTGKSCTLGEVVPAVVAETLSKQPPGHPLKGMAVLKLNGMDLERQKGATVLLYNILQVVVKWAEVTNVPVEDMAWRKAQKVLAAGRNDPGLGSSTSALAGALAGRAIVELFAGFQAPVLVLLDELQALLQPTSVGGKLDLSGAEYIRDVVLRRILNDSPNTVLWAVTGSSMALVWMALAAMPVCGAAPIQQVCPVHLPSAFPPSLMQALVDHNLRWRGLQRQDVEPLLEWSGGSPALFTTILDHRECRPVPVDTDVFIADFIHDKMQEEAWKGWMPALAHLTDEERSGVLDLASVTKGAQAEGMNRGLLRFLRPHLQQTARGRYYLTDANQRQLLRTIIDRGGKLRTNWSGFKPVLTLVQLDWGWQLLQLGEVADYLLGLRPRHKAIPEDIDGVDQLKAMLQGLADKAVEQLPAGDSVAGRWEALGTFIKVLRSPYNTGSRCWYESGGKTKLKHHLDFLVFFLRLSRNILAHQKPWDGTDLADVEVVMALPRLVDMRVTELSEVVRVGVGALAPATIQAATDAAAAADGDDGGGTGGISSCDNNHGRGSPTATPAVCSRGSNMGSGLVSCTSTSRATALSSGPQAALSKAGKASLGRPGPGRMVLPAPARLHSMRVMIAKQPPFLFT